MESPRAGTLRGDRGIRKIAAPSRTTLSRSLARSPVRGGVAVDGVDRADETSRTVFCRCPLSARGRLGGATLRRGSLPVVAALRKERGMHVVDLHPQPPGSGTWLDAGLRYDDVAQGLGPSERSRHPWRRKQSGAAVSDVPAAERLSQHDRVARLRRAVCVNGPGGMPGAQGTRQRRQPTAADRAGLSPVSADTLAEGVARRPDEVAVPCSHDAGRIVRSRACVLSRTVVGAHPSRPEHQGAAKLTPVAA